MNVKERWQWAWSRYGIGKIPVKEHRFHVSRRYRFDFAWPVEKIAIEIDGFGGGHQTNAKLAKDNEKMNLALEHGWLVFRFTSKQLGSKLKCQRACQQVLAVLKRRRLEQQQIRDPTNICYIPALYASLPQPPNP